MNQGFAVHGNILSPSECDEVLYSLLANRKPVKAGLRNLMGKESSEIGL